MRNDSFILVEGWMINDLNLRGNELLVYAIIYGFSRDGESKYEGGRKWLAESINISVRSLGDILNSLVQKNMLTKNVEEKNGIKFIKYTANFPTREESSWGGREESSLGVGKKLPTININTNSYIQNNKRDIRESHTEEAKHVIDYLNQQAGTHFKYSQTSMKHIIARFNDGFTVSECEEVIDKKCIEWLRDPKMQKYLRPETLFGSKFEGYLNQRYTPPKGGDLAF